MSLPDDLLEQAVHLADRDPRKPRQASLRRAVSSAYYALFHLLVEEASGLFTATPGVAYATGRALSHGEMLTVSQRFAVGQLPKSIAGAGGPLFATSAGPAGDAVKRVAATFVLLQQKRHEADYDRAKSFTRSEVKQLLGRAQEAFTDWAGCRRSEPARLYLGCLFLWDRWDKAR